MDCNEFLDDLLFGPELIDEWEMVTPERIVFQTIVERLRPRKSLEIGSRNGGSLQILKRFSQNVVCVDIDETLPTRLGSAFGCVDFVLGDSRDTLPKLMKDMEANNDLPDFVHIDGDHTTDGARRDLQNILNVKPNNRMIVLMHDTFNPDVRVGIKSIDFGKVAYLQYVDLDFMTGILHSREPVMKEMWGGFSLFILDAELRSDPIQVNNYLEPQFLLTKKGSIHI